MRELSLHILDIAQNSIAAYSSLIEITVKEISKDNQLVIEVKDNGIGMSNEDIKKVVDPFYTTRNTRDVGLGVPLFKMSAEITGGDFKISSKPKKGTLVSGTFISSSIDMTPLGNVNATIGILIRCNPNTDFVYTRILDNKFFTLDTREIKDVLANSIAINSNEVMLWISEFLEEQTNVLLGGV